MKALWPYVTCSGQVYRAQVVGFFDGQGPVARAEIVIDATQQPARLAYWKDLRVLGRGFTTETLGGATTYDPRAKDEMGTGSPSLTGQETYGPPKTWN